ncbi:hypothetical protein K3495_g14761 [Podosphaera aphanis]|nr:hypothetical protein K3495_g14761 [Podosphaera aphanis]
MASGDFKWLEENIVFKIDKKLVRPHLNLQEMAHSSSKNIGGVDKKRVRHSLRWDDLRKAHNVVDTDQEKMTEDDNNSRGISESRVFSSLNEESLTHSSDGLQTCDNNHTSIPGVYSSLDPNQKRNYHILTYGGVTAAKKREGYFSSSCDNMVKSDGNNSALRARFLVTSQEGRN